MAVLATYALAIVGTFVILKVVDALVGLRVTEEDEVSGLDLSQHSETAYAFGGGSYGEFTQSGRSLRREHATNNGGEATAGALTALDLTETFL